MATFKNIQLELNHKFDPKTGRHFINGIQTVFHCHHFTTLYTQLAIDANETNLLSDSAEDAFYHLLTDYFQNRGINSIEERIELACQYYGAIGLGKLELQCIGDFSGLVKSSSSHIEAGWIKKWGKFDKPVNFIGSGFVSAMFSAVLNLPKKTFKVFIEKSIVMGDEYTLFNLVKI